MSLFIYLFLFVCWDLYQSIHSICRMFFLIRRVDVCLLNGWCVESFAGPGSLPPGLVTKRRGFDDGASDISSNQDYIGKDDYLFT